MKEQDKIPVTKAQRAAKFVGTGAKMGGNYLKYYAKKLVDPNTDKTELDKANANDVYNSLSQLKGSALKVAQMMSMDENILPKAYSEKFQMAQYNAPPLSYPLVVKTFKRYFEKGPLEIFDTFTQSAVNAASIGQVHKATIGDQTFAVKVQYPGVADSVSSDLKLAKPIAMRLMNISSKDINHYLKEVEDKLLEETDYELELKRSILLTESCKNLPNLRFPSYYPEFSSKRVIAMDWINGVHLSEWIKQDPSQAERNRIGQALWDFYDHQIHHIKSVHADPHPGNFLITPEGDLGIIDFGCVKEIPESFYSDYFALMKPGLVTEGEAFVDLLFKLDFIKTSDSDKEKDFFIKTFSKMVGLLGQPFAAEEFDFSKKDYFDQIYTLGDEISNDKQFRKSNSARGSKHGIYINRTYFGLYNILHQIGAKVKSGIDQNHIYYSRAS